MSLGNCEITAFLATTRAEESRAFYCDLLGLPLEDDGPFALVVRGANASVRIQKVHQFVPLPFTAMGWQVHDLTAKVKELTAKGVTFERFDGMRQDELGIWQSPSGARVVWFKDPEGNVLSLTQA
jgi:catechol 2,3-dioxygenase-like lactoylglutathione lyase family enzyme